MKLLKSNHLFLTPAPFDRRSSNGILDTKNTGRAGPDKEEDKI